MDPLVFVRDTMQCFEENESHTLDGEKRKCVMLDINIKFTEV